MQGVEPEMPRYFFDFMEGGSGVPDDEGTELADLAHARKVAVKTLGQIGKDEFDKASHDRELVVKVRSEEGRALLYATLSLQVVLPT